MVKLSVDLDEVDDSAFEIVDAGKYNAKVTDVVEQESSSGHPMLVWNWEIIGGDFNGTTLKSYTTLQAHALFGLKEHLAAFGVEGNLDGFETDAMIGKTAQLTVTKNMVVSKDSGEDIEVNRISKVNPSAKKGKGKGASKQMSKSEIPL